MSPKWQSQQCALLQGSSQQHQGLSQPGGGCVKTRITYQTFALTLCGRPSLPIPGRAVFQVSPPVTFIAPHLCVEGLNCCRSGKRAGVPGLKLLLPLANTFSVHRPDYTPLSTKARQNLTVNSLRKKTP